MITINATVEHACFKQSSVVNRSILLISSFLLILDLVKGLRNQEMSSKDFLVNLKISVVN